MLKVLIVVLIIFLVYLLVVVVANRTARPTAGRLAISHGAPSQFATESISISTWNIGYAGLGKESDFVVDGGKALLPPSKKIVQKNLNGIIRIIKSMQSDIFLIQELAEPGLLNYSVDVRGAVSKAFGDRDRTFMYDLRTKFIPKPISVVSGVGLFSKFPIEVAERIPLPVEPTYFFSIFRKMYGIQMSRFKLAGSERKLVIMNIHLAAFDEGAETRVKQLETLFARAVSEYGKGHYVIIGGDWNVEFVANSFPHQTEEKYRSWISPFPEEAVPEGWQLSFDPSTPTLRTAYQPYVPGENYVTIIDGFVVSPNVEILSVEGMDLGFEYTDHHPVTLKVAFRH